jgi:hypothetical protein
MSMVTMVPYTVVHWVAVSGEVYAQSAVLVLMLVWKKKRFGRALKRGVCGGSIN